MNYLIFHPDPQIHATDNEQTIEMCRILEEKYKVMSFEWFLKHPFEKNIKVIYLNWFENPLHNKYLLIQIISYFIKYMILVWCKLRRIKIIYAIHNKTPHGVKNISYTYKWIIKPFIIRALSLSNIIVIHSKKTKDYICKEYGVKINDNRVHYIPIGKSIKYLSDYNNYSLREKYSIPKNKLVFGYYGRLERYKQLEIAISAFNKANVDAMFVIIGKASNEYESELSKLIHNNNIIFENRYLDDYEMNEAIKASDVLILSYDYSCLNSGPMLQAFLNGTNVLGTAIGTVYDFPKQYTYTYDYLNYEDHINKLLAGIDQIALDKKSGKLEEKNKKLQQYIIENNNWDKICKEVLSFV